MIGFWRRDGFADKFYYWTWHDNEFRTILLPTVMFDVLTNPIFPWYSKNPDGSRSYNPVFDRYKLPRRLLVTSPTLAFLIFGACSGIVSLLLVETMANIHGNNSFQVYIEYSTIAHLYLGRKAHILMQVLLYCALQSVNDRVK
jgi:hypothetical protein